MQEERDYQFAYTVFNRPVQFTYVLFGANILVYLLMELAGGSENPLTVLAFGGKSNPEIGRGEIWRLITPAFIHIGLIHLAANSFSLWNVGPVVEKFYGGARFVILYIGSGIGGILAGYWFSPRSISAGASGAILGLCGVLVVCGFMNRNTIPPNFRKRLLQSLGASVLLTLFLGYRYGAGSGATLPIDNAAHIGGFVTGALLAFVVPFDNPFEPPGRGHALYRFLQIASLAGVLAAFAAVAVHYNGPKFSVPNAARRLSPFSKRKMTDIESFIEVLNGAQRSQDRALRALESGDAGTVAAAGKATAAAIDRLREMPSIDPSADRWVEEFRATLEDEYALEQDIIRAGAVTPALRSRADDGEERYKNLVDRFEMWVDTEGSRYGLAPDPSESFK